MFIGTGHAFEQKNVLIKHADYNNKKWTQTDALVCSLVQVFQNECTQHFREGQL